MNLNNSTLALIIKSARPRQWIKNIALYAALVFSGLFFFTPGSGVPYFITVSHAFVIFCLLASTVYIINDLLDYDLDRHHPFKQKRPIASGQLSKQTAWAAVGAGILLVATLSWPLSGYFKLMILTYLLLQVAYAKKIKNIPILDVASIAAGFIIRIYAGAVVVNLHTSVWFLLTVLSASLFLAVGKRQSERTLMSGKDSSIGETRKTLRRYSQRLLDQYTAMFATTTWLTYALYSFQREAVTPKGQLLKLYTLLPKTLHSQKLLMLSIPLVVVGVMRYLQLIYEDNKGESPEVILLRDKGLLTIVFLFGGVVMLVIYGLG